MTEWKKRLPAYVFGTTLLGAGIIMNKYDWYFWLSGRADGGRTLVSGLTIIATALVFLTFQFSRARKRR